MTALRTRRRDDILPLYDHGPKHNGWMPSVDWNDCGWKPQPRSGLVPGYSVAISGNSSPSGMKAIDMEFTQ